MGLNSITTGNKRWIVWLAAVFCIFICLLFGYYLVYHSDPLDSIRHRKDAYSSLSVIAEELTEALSDRQDKDMVVYVRDMDLDEIRYVNYYMDTIDGTVTDFTVYPSVFGVREVRFKIERSDNSYVYDAYVNNIPIPSDRPKAEILYKKVCDILDKILYEDMTVYNKELAIHDYIIEHCEYSTGREDDKNEFRAYGALVDGKAVCNGYAEAMSLLLSCAEVENRYVIGTAIQPFSVDRNTEDKGDGGHPENHAWNQVCINQKWFNVDATWDDPDIGMPVVSHRYFNITDEILREDHTWSEEKAKKCVDMDWNYFEKKNLYSKNGNISAEVKKLVSGHPHGYLELAFSGNNPSENDLETVFSVPGVSKLSYLVSGNGKYKILHLFIN